MSFSDLPFAYGPFVPHHIPKLYIEGYFAHHKLDSLLSLNTTVEDVSLIKTPSSSKEKWKLTLRKHDSVRQVDVWWEDHFDAVVFANGHYSVPFVCQLVPLNSPSPALN
jgi:cation diffusion facilitator CzcD-associated flavoprotein CzcO